VLLAIWLHRPDLFAVTPYVVMAAVSMMLSTKEHKFQFQSSTNTHEGMAKAMFLSYVAMAALSIPVIAWRGMLGFLFLWIAVELFQTAFVVRLNHRLFAEIGGHTNRYVYRLAALCIVGLYAAGTVLAHTHTDPFVIQIGAGFAVSACLALAAFFLFNMRGTIKAVSGRFRRASDIEKLNV
jgi:hypothetical protein